MTWFNGWAIKGWIDAKTLVNVLDAILLTAPTHGAPAHGALAEPVPRTTMVSASRNCAPSHNQQKHFAVTHIQKSHSAKVPNIKP